MKRAHVVLRGVALAVAPLLTAGVAAAAGRVPVAVVPANEADNPAVIGSVWALRSALESRDELAPVSIEDKLADAGPSPTEEGRAALVEGRQAFGDLDLERAAHALETAARLLAPIKTQRDDAVEALDLLAQTRLCQPLDNHHVD